MSEKQLNELLNEIAPEDKPDYRWIDCSEDSGYADDNQYQRIIAAIRQNIELQQKNAELTKKIEEVESQGMESLMQIEILKKDHEAVKENFIRFMNELCKFLETIDKQHFPLRIGNYMFVKLDKGLVIFKYDPILEPEPIDLTIKITENSDKETKCPLCGNQLGKYPAISREDNKTKICSNCGTLEALKIFKESLKDDEVNA